MCGDSSMGTIATGLVIVLYTMISTSTSTVTVFALTYLRNEIPNFPNIALISGLMSFAKIASSFLIFIFPNRNYEIMTILGLKAICVAGLSLASSALPDNLRGPWVSACMVLLTFSCGTTVARAMTITHDEDDTRFLSNCFTVGKSAVHGVELLATLAFFEYFGWQGLMVWVCCAYAVVTCTTLSSLCYSAVKERRDRRRQLGYKNIEEINTPPHEWVYTEEDPLLLTPSTPRRVRVSSVQEGISDSSNEQEWMSLPASGRNRTLSVNSVGSILTSISQTPNNSSGHHLRVLWNDVKKANLVAWLYLFFSEMGGMTMAIIILCGSSYVHDCWHYSPSQAALTIMLPQLLVIPIFCLVSLIRIPVFTRVIIGNGFIAVIGFFPLIKNPILLAFLIIVCELFNALRTSAQMPAFNQLVPSPRIARRFVSISTVFVFTLRTIGYSGGSAFYDTWAPLPFYVAAVCQVGASIALIGIHRWAQPQIREMERQKFDKTTAINEQTQINGGTPGSTVSRKTEHHSEK